MIIIPSYKCVCVCEGGGGGGGWSIERTTCGETVVTAIPDSERPLPTGWVGVSKT